MSGIDNNDNLKKNVNPDPITGEPGSHPVGTAVGGTVGVAAGLAGAAATGAAAGSTVGPVGTAAGGIIGAIIGAFTGKGVAEAINPTEDQHWEQTYKNSDYADKKVGYEQYKPAYGYGTAAKNHYSDKSFDEVHDELKSGWEKVRGQSTLSWDKAKDATRDAFNRVIQLHDEKLRADKTNVKAGEVNIRKEVVTEQKTLDVPVTHEELVIERRPVSAAGQVAGEIKSEEIRIPLSEERVTVSKETVLREEVSIGKKTVQETQRVSGAVRHEELRIEEEGETVVRGDTDLLAKKPKN